MSQREKFKGFDFSYNPFEEEARQLWGDGTVESSNDFIASKSDRDKKDMEKILDELFRGLAEIRDEDPDSDLAQEAIDRMYRVFNESFGHYHSLESFAALGNMYVMDDLFRANIDKYGKRVSGVSFKSNAGLRRQAIQRMNRNCLVMGLFVYDPGNY